MTRRRAKHRMASKRTNKTLSLSQKQNIIEAVDNGTKKIDVAKQFEIAPSTLTSILKKRDFILQSSPSSKAKRQKLPKFPDVEKALVLWFRQCRESNLEVSGPLLMEKANFFAKKLNVNNFKASNGWLDKVKKRNNITYKKICGKSAAVDENVCLEWKEKLKDLIKYYDANDIFNADETGLFYKCLPDHTFCFKDEKCHGGKHSKERVTLLFAANMDGTEKLKPLLIGKSAKSRCFKNIRTFPAEYRYNKKAWMTTEIFNEWLQMLDNSMKSQNRKIVLFVDNCTAHNRYPDLSYIKVEFLSPNTSSVLQPLDKGIIKNFKTLYRKDMVTNLVSCIDGKREFVFTLQTSMLMAYKAWMNISQSCIQN
ncbi:tigger transposable element-derived protein 6-like [Musca domestica]|uniref:Tigger transposable element-derived protein 6-like n=1 Tax=Musca domestica TaxID=7370 RepID=A0A9J7IGC6_MUSDO|nr:tigger transposable element-derived protein 6-like [Musca domestica]